MGGGLNLWGSEQSARQSPFTGASAITSLRSSKYPPSPLITAPPLHTAPPSGSSPHRHRRGGVLPVTQLLPNTLLAPPHPPPSCTPSSGFPLPACSSTRWCHVADGCCPATTRSRLNPSAFRWKYGGRGGDRCGGSGGAPVGEQKGERNESLSGGCRFWRQFGFHSIRVSLN